MKEKSLPVVVSVVVCLLVTLTLCDQAWTQQTPNNSAAVNPLVQVLQAKGILTAEEVAQISQASSASDGDRRLAKLLLTKGVISQADYDQTVSAPATMNVSTAAVPGPTVVPAVYRVPLGNGATIAVSSPPADQPTEKKPAAPAFIAAITPTRTLPVGALPREAGTPGFKVGAVRVTPYGFLKATAVHDSSSPNGDDFPLPGFIAADTGLNGGPEFHLKARASRIGTNLEWLDPSEKFTITGKFEADFEGNFSRADNRNISAARSSMLGIRLAYTRLDYKYSDKDAINLVFGQDWTPFASSTLPNLLETTGLGIAFGTAYEREPQMRFGYTHNFGSFQLMPEVAMVFPLFGNLPAAANLANQLGYGERQGADSGRPEVQGRLVGQFQLDHAKGVAPAQIIFSAMQGRRDAVVLASAVPAAFKAAFPHGANATSNTDGWTGEFQLPTRYITVLGKYYSGSDLRFFFAGQLFSNFNDTAGLTGATEALSVDGSSAVIFGTDASGNSVVAPQRPIRSQGGFLNIGLPLSRIFNADPKGRNSGWSMYFHYGEDFAKARDLRRTFGATSVGARHKSSMFAGTLYYKLNNWVTFGFEQSLYETDAIPGTSTTQPFPLFNGVQARVWRDLRSEGGPIITF